MATSSTAGGSTSPSVIVPISCVAASITALVSTWYSRIGRYLEGGNRSASSNLKRESGSAGAVCQTERRSVSSSSLHGGRDGALWLRKHCRARCRESSPYCLFARSWRRRYSNVACRSLCCSFCAADTARLWASVSTSDCRSRRCSPNAVLCWLPEREVLRASAPCQRCRGCVRGGSLTASSACKRALSALTGGI